MPVLRIKNDASLVAREACVFDRVPHKAVERAGKVLLLAVKAAYLGIFMRGHPVRTMV
jgi:hypothetical protein